MRWPFVPRSLFDETVADLRVRLDASDLDRRRLTRTIVKLKISGAHIPRVLDGARLEQRPRDPFEQIVDENPRAQQDPRLRRHLLTWATRQHQLHAADECSGLSDEAIKERLRTWSVVTVEEDDDDEDDEVIAV